MKRTIKGHDGRRLFDPARTVAALLKLPPVEWPAAIAKAKLTQAEQSDLVSSLDRHAEACAALSGYLEQGPKGARKRRRAVSRALGYTYPERRALRSIEN